MKRKRAGLRIFRWIKKFILVLFLLQLFYIIILKWVYPPVTITQLQSFFSGTGLRRDYVKWNEISYNMKLAVIASEDQIFPDHSGFDWKNIKKAMKYNEEKPNRIRGASTISQQVAKNVFLWQGRSWIRKGLEVYFTKMIEWIWGKERILAVYLNVIETGKGMFGAEAAARKYFKKSAKAVTKKEAAMIAACLPNPKKYSVNPASPYVVFKTNWVLQQMQYLQRDNDVESVIK
ncbi:MAG: monofunctional biosynthetic peptidoglycan transglycosylase [Chitinophagaceae bacterium]